MRARRGSRGANGHRPYPCGADEVSRHRVPSPLGKSLQASAPLGRPFSQSPVGQPCSRNHILENPPLLAYLLGGRGADWRYGECNGPSGIRGCRRFGAHQCRSTWRPDLSPPTMSQRSQATAFSRPVGVGALGVDRSGSAQIVAWWPNEIPISGPCPPPPKRSPKAAGSDRRVSPNIEALKGGPGSKRAQNPSTDPCANKGDTVPIQ